MVTNQPGSPIELVLYRLRGVRKTKAGWDALCPAHDDQKPSLGVAVGNDGKVLLKCRSQGCGPDAICKALGLNLPDLFLSKKGKDPMNIIAKYDYVDAGGKLLYQTVRLDPKDFLQRRPDPKGKDGWTWNLEGVQRVLYRLPEVMRAVADGQPIYVVEGEKDADNLAWLGLVATTNSGGAGKWRGEYGQTLRGADVVLLPDHDEAGQRHMAMVAERLHGMAKSIRVVNLPDLPPKGDVSDWLSSGRTLQQLEDRVSMTSTYQPEKGQQQLAGGGESEAQEKGETHAKALVRLATGAAVFHHAEGRAYATVRVKDRTEVLSVRGMEFKRWLALQYYAAHKKPPSSAALNEALGVVEAQALFEGPELPVHVRVAGLEGKIYLDLCNPEREVVEIGPGGWTIRRGEDVPVKFRRPPGMGGLPRPVRGGRLEDLRKLLGIDEERSWRLLVGFLVMGLRDRGPYPVLGIHGEQGSGKSTRARVVRSLIDPNAVPLRCEPKDPRDLMIAANNAWCVAYDNLSHLAQWLSDALCRLATGGGYSTRELYSDDGERLFDSMRPIILTGIEGVVTRPDLLDRAILLEVPCIATGKRRTEQELFAAINPALPGILGALLDAVACALENQAAVKLPILPRMADFAKWVTAAEPALGWVPGAFLAAYLAGQDETNEVALETYPVGDPLRQLMEDRRRWEGKPSELHALLGEIARDRGTRVANWPKSPNALSGQLKRLAPNLRKIGIHVTFGSTGRGKAKARQIVIDTDNGRDSSSPASGSSTSTGMPENGDGDGGGDGDDPSR